MKLKYWNDVGLSSSFELIDTEKETNKDENDHICPDTVKQRVKERAVVIMRQYSSEQDCLDDVVKVIIK